MRRADEEGGDLRFLDEAMAAWPGFIVHLDGDDRIRYLSRIPPQLAPDSVIGVSVFEFIDPADHPMIREAFAEARETGRPTRYRARPVGAKGQPGVYLNEVVPDGGSSPNLTVFGLDQSEAIAAARETASAAAKLELALEAAGMAVFELAIPSGEGTWDERMRAIHGMDEPADGLEYIERVVHPDEKERLGELLASFLQGDESATEYRILRPDGESRWLRTMAHALRDDAGRVHHLVGGVIDITEERALFEHQRKAQMLAAIGTLTSGVAKRFNDVLMVLTTILDEVGPSIPHDQHAVLDDANEAVTRGSELVENLLAFSGRGSEGHIPVRLDELVTQVARFCEQTFGRAVHIRTTVEGPLWVRGDAGALHQVLMNLMINARDALSESEGGTVALVAEPAGELARVSVSDDGPGMDPAVAARVFEPFFSTKGVRGTGLGLSSSLGIVQDHAGELVIDERTRLGATFVLTLPRTEREA